jgi:transcriptional regulator GlxA family with amidase domain
MLRASSMTSSSVATTPARLGHLVMRAMALFESNREMAWRCLKDARLGCSPTTYVAVRRVERAKLMFTSTREGLGTIALACGFADQSHFSRRFRHVVGMSPARWRRASIRNSA